MATEMTVSEARASLPQLVERVQAGEEVTLTRHGRPVAVLVRPDTLRSRRADAALATAEGLRVLLEEGRRSPLYEARLTPDRAEELLTEVRAGRSRD